MEMLEVLQCSTFEIGGFPLFFLLKYEVLNKVLELSSRGIFMVNICMEARLELRT